MKIIVGVTNRHLHLSKEDLNILFGEGYELTKRNDLAQTGEFACEETVTLKTNKGIKEHVRIVGPIRSYTQVEILGSDKEVLGINPPYRDSGDLENSESITIVGPNNEIYKKNCCIIPNRHIHINNSNTYGFKNGDIVSVNFNDLVIDNVHIKIDNNYVLEFQINKDEALKLNIRTGDYVDLR